MFQRSQSSYSTVVLQRHKSSFQKRSFKDTTERFQDLKVRRKTFPELWKSFPHLKSKTDDATHSLDYSEAFDQLFCSTSISSLSTPTPQTDSSLVINKKSKRVKRQLVDLTGISFPHFHFHNAPTDVLWVDPSLQEIDDSMEEWDTSACNNIMCHINGILSDIDDIGEHYESQLMVSQTRCRVKRSSRRSHLHGTVPDKHIIDFRSSARVYIKARIYKQILKKFIEKFNSNQLSIGQIVITPSQSRQLPQLLHYAHLAALSSRNGLLTCQPNLARLVVGLRPSHQVNVRPAETRYGTLPPHALVSENAPVDLDRDLVAILMELQNRDITPEDYEMLLRLDEARVKPKTVNANKLKRLKTAIISDTLFEESAACCICQEIYCVDKDEVKFLPCDHFFHIACIDHWLTNSSQNCPLDGVPVPI